MNRLLYILLTSCVLLLTCQRQQPCTKTTSPPSSALQEAWMEAQKKGTIEAYQLFIDQYPCNDSLVKLAKQKIDSIKEEQAWQRVKKTNSVDSLRAFCLAYPYSLHHTQAYHLANKILHDQLDTRYRVVPEFFNQMSQASDLYSVFRKYADPDFCLIKTRQYEEHQPVRDTFPVPDKQAFDSLLNTNVFKVCNRLFTQGQLLKDYELACDDRSFSIIFHLPCGDIRFRWLTDHTMKLRCVEICQDLRL